MSETVADLHPGFEAFYASEHGRLVTTLLLATGDAEVAREATDEAFTRALQAWRRVQHMESPAGWTYRVALNVVRRRGRRAALERRLLAGRARPLGSGAVPAPAGEAWHLVASSPEVAAIQHDLLADPNVTGLLYSTHADSYERFQCLFSDQPQLIESVQPANLPETLSVDIVGGQAEFDGLSSWLDAAPVDLLQLPVGSPYHVSQPDVSYAASATMPLGAAIGGMNYQTSTSIRDCPFTGTTLR